MSYYYNIRISNTEPTNPWPGLFWLKPSEGLIMVFGTTRWIPFCSGNPIASYIEGMQWLEQKVQESKPEDVIGSMWIMESIGQAFMYIDTWQPCAGG